MILLASRQDDGTTLYVIEWLIAFKKKFVRINTDDKNTIFSYFDANAGSLIVRHHQKEINLLDTESIWIRRNGFSLNNVLIDEDILKKNVFFDTDGYHKKHLQSESKLLVSYFHTLIRNKCKKTLGSFEFGEVNKMNVLEEAKKIGLKIPESYIVTGKRQLNEIFSKNKHILTKSLGSGVYLFKGDLSYYSYTERITQSQINKLPEQFFPSLIQIEIEKKYELRIFYLKGKFYSMAIFSQRNKDTVTDFRKGGASHKPNRKVPYKLPEVIEVLLTNLMNKLNLDSGSIDIIVDADGNYVFLEVNPVGQFSMTSQPCNYYLEKKVAELL